MQKVARGPWGIFTRVAVFTAFFLTVFLAFSFVTLAHADVHPPQVQNAPSLLQKVAAENFQHPGAHRLGIEVEIVGVQVEDVLRLAQKQLGGVYSVTVSPEGLQSGTLKNSRIGTLVVKHETNQTSEGHTPQNTWVVELVTQPLYYEQVEPFHQLVKSLPSIGAKGTLTGGVHAVSTQVNLEVAPAGMAPEAQVETVLEILRFYFSSQNIYQIRREQNIPNERMRFLGPFSPGFMNKLESAVYQPTARELFDDFFYRQSAEYLGRHDAWTAPLSEIQTYIQALPKPVMAKYPQLAKVVKLQSIRVSSWLMLMFPDDWFSQMILSEEWAKPHPILEFRDWNNTFDVLTPVREVLGLYFQAKKKADVSTADTNAACVMALRKAG